MLTSLGLEFISCPVLLRRPDFVIDSTFDLFVDLGAPDHLVDFPVRAAAIYRFFFAFEQQPSRIQKTMCFCEKAGPVSSFATQPWLFE